MVERHMMSQSRSMSNGSSPIEELGEVAFDDDAAGRAAAAVALHALVGRDLDREARDLARVREEE